MAEIAIRFLIGGLVVSAFSILPDLFTPKSFAGLFGAAPSVALASIVLTVHNKGKGVAAVEARSMIIGALALLVYAALVSHALLRFRVPALKTSLAALLVWLAAAVALWCVAPV